MRAFLTAEWRYLAILNYGIDPRALLRYVPKGTELDSFDGVTYVSMVGFLFLDTKVLGVPIPFHRDFEEVNLRFYVRRKVDGGWRRGVVFVKEIVPKFAIAAVARGLYGEKYVSMPMRHDTSYGTIRYGWKLDGNWNELWVRPYGEPSIPQPGSVEEFITEHYWGYAESVEYRVDHPQWRVWQSDESGLRIDAAELYGDEFVEPLSTPPKSAFLAEGSAVTVYQGSKLELKL